MFLGYYSVIIVQGEAILQKNMATVGEANFPYKLACIRRQLLL